MCFQHICFSFNNSHFPILIIPHIYTFILIQWNTLPLLYYLYLNRRTILSRSHYHPSLTSSSLYPFIILKIL
jgi:hypothetical protein